MLGPLLSICLLYISVAPGLEANVKYRCKLVVGTVQGMVPCLYTRDISSYKWLKPGAAWIFILVSMPGWACNNTNRTIKQMKLSQHKIHLMRSIETWWRNAILIMVFMRKQGNGCRSAVMGLPWLWGCNKVTSRTVMGFHAVLGINKATNVAKFQTLSTGVCLNLLLYAKFII